MARLARPFRTARTSGRPVAAGPAAAASSPGEVPAASPGRAPATFPGEVAAASPGAPREARREVFGWSMYGWANHGWATTVATVLIGPWLLALATQGRSGRAVLFSIGPLPVHADAYPSLAITAAAVLQLLVLPLVGSAGDRVGSRRRWLVRACLAGAAIAALLATSGGGQWLYAGLLFLAGSLVFGVSDVLYNSFLPQIAPPQRRDAVSSAGFAYGYTGAGLLLAVNLAVIGAHQSLGLGKSAAVRICFVTAGAWWAGFGVFALRRLRDRPPGAAGAPRRASGTGPGGVPGAWQRLAEAFRMLAGMPMTRRYLVAFLLFSDAITAVIALSSTFITHQLFGDSASAAAGFLFTLILLIQFVAVAGSLLFARLAARLGTKRAVLLALAIWCLIIGYAYLDLRTKAQAVGAGVAIGLVLGGSQALARSLYSQLIPAGREATFFALYEVANQGSSWIAPLLFTLVVDATGSFRQAILSLLVLFVAGGALLAGTDLSAAAREVPAVPAPRQVAGEAAAD